MNHRDEGNSWDRRGVVILPGGVAMEAAGLHPIRAYNRRMQANIAEKLACRTIYELCAKAERMPWTIRMVRWWYQDVVNEPEE